MTIFNALKNILSVVSYQAIRSNVALAWDGFEVGAICKNRE